jgi:addiction module HigA family antidote
VPPRRVNEIVLGKRTIAPDTAARFAKAFGMSAQFWLDLRNRYDLEKLAIVMGNTYDSIETLQHVVA